MPFSQLKKYQCCCVVGRVFYKLFYVTYVRNGFKKNGRRKLEVRRMDYSSQNKLQKEVDSMIEKVFMIMIYL